MALPALGAARIDYFADLIPVPHNSAVDSGSNVTGSASIEYVRGTTYRVTVTASGLSPNLPHLTHIHGVVQAQNECPDASAAGPDVLIDTRDGLRAYGPILVTFSTSGDTSAGAGLSIGTAPVADGSGNLSCQREIKIKGNVAANLKNLHVVIHGEDLNDRTGMTDRSPRSPRAFRSKRSCRLPAVPSTDRSRPLRTTAAHIEWAAVGASDPRLKRTRPQPRRTS